VAEIVSGGIYVVQLLARPQGLGEGLLPDRILTLSGCLTELFPEEWALEWVSCDEAERVESAAKLGIAAQRVPLLVQRMTQEFDAGRLGWPCVWQSLEAARAAAAEFELDEQAFALLELGVPADCVSELATQLQPQPAEGACGLYVALQQQRPLPAGGVDVGWEVLGAERGGSLHSWLCNSLERDALERLQLRPGALGLLASEAEARAVLALIASGIGAEPVPWFPAVLRRHALSA
jgi:hypothetical protein